MELASSLCQIPPPALHLFFRCAEISSQPVVHFFMRILGQSNSAKHFEKHFYWERHFHVPTNRIFLIFVSHYHLSWPIKVSCTLSSTRYLHRTGLFLIRLPETINGKYVPKFSFKFDWLFWLLLRINIHHYYFTYTIMHPNFTNVRNTSLSRIVPQFYRAFARKCRKLLHNAISFKCSASSEKNLPSKLLFPRLPIARALSITSIFI